MLTNADENITSLAEAIQEAQPMQTSPRDATSDI